MPHDIFQQLDFHPATSHWFTDRFEGPSPPQILGWPKISSGEHTLILAPTGSGKTLAAFLWCLDELFRLGLSTDAVEFATNTRGVHTLYVSPLKALNTDIQRNLEEPLAGMRAAARKLAIDPPHIRTAVRTGDTPPHLRQSMVKKPPHILITTPESLYLLLTSEKGRLIFRHLRYIIVDEIHAVSSNKRGVHLSLSLERLLTLVEREPVRIGLSATQKPLGRIAHFLGGQSYDPATTKHAKRPVAIVDAGQRKNIDLQVISPVEKWSDVPDASVWPLVIDKCYELITSHKNTLVFVNMRAQAEKTARQLNELHRERTANPAAVLALAHHGSLSREMRYEIEARLKSGAIPAVIATASLELGIDIGGIDLVVQLQSPGSVSAGLQRIGRSGHLLTSTSVGRIMPLYQADVDDCVAIAQAILGRDIEETAIAENALDVLAQQIVAEVSMRDWPRLDLYHLVRSSYCFRTLSETAFNNVVDMLAGRFGRDELRALQPRLSRDRVNDRLIARRASRLLAVINGGTIADRAYYGVYLEGSNSRLGEVEEEFVFESKVGDIFFLGNSEWRINDITPDRIMVTPRGAAKPKAPFWKGEPAYRDFMTSRKIGAFRKEIMANEHLSSQDIHADANTLASLRSFLLRQQQHTGQIPTDHDIVVEYFRDAVAEPHVVVHAPFGGRVIGAWATALAAAMEHRYGSQVQFAHDNDGMLFRLPDFEEIPEFDKLLNMPFAAIEKLLIEAIANTPMFITEFRHNATRALLLARSRAGKRIPLWLQRLRAADLLQAVREMPDFPILLETYRECLQDLFDIRSLKIVLDEIGVGETRMHPVRTSSPSPMTAGLLFRFLSEQMYDYDRFRTVGHAAETSSELLADILARDEIPTIISKELISAALEHWQHLHPDQQAKDSETCYGIIEKLGPITRQDLAARCARDPADWLHSLMEQNRIQFTERGWIHTRMSYSSDDKKELVRRYLRIRGPQTVAQLTAELDMEQSELRAILSTLLEEKEIARGLFVIGETEEQWCDRDNLSFLYRQAIAARRRAHEPGDRATFMKFQMLWHHIARPHRSMLEVIRQYAGLSFPLAFFERDILPNRTVADAHDLVAQLADLVAEGEIAPIADKTEGGRFHVRFNPRGQEHLFHAKEELDERAAELGTDAQAVYQFLKENGASLYHDIRDGTGLQSIQVDESLTLLCRRGLLSCDHLPSFYAILQNDPALTSAEPWHEQIKQPWSPSRWRREPALRHAIKSRLRARQGRWFLTSSYAVMGRALQPEKRAETHARLLLQRYGIVVKEFYRHEQGLAPWYAIFQALKRMEWSGEIRRGYFITGFSGVQFASHEALQVLEQQSSQPSGLHATCLLSAIDPALPFGGQLAWGLVSNDGAIAVVRSSANHIFLNDGKPLAYLENWGARLRLVSHSDAHKLADLPELLKRWLRQPEPLRPRKKLELVNIDGRPAAQHDLASLFSEHGFEKDGDRLVLWPSNLSKLN